MSTEIRNVIPYFSELQIVLNDGTIESTEYNPETQRTYRVRRELVKGIAGVITGWLDADTVIYDEPFQFVDAPKDGSPSMNSILTKASAEGVDIVTALEEAFDLVADQFPVTKQQAPEMQVLGPKVILRPDAFVCALDERLPMSVTIKVGIYTAKKEGENWVPNKLKQNRYLTFEDSKTLQNRKVLLEQLEASIVRYTKSVADFNTLIEKKMANQPLPEGTNEVYLTMGIEELKAVRNQEQVQLDQAKASKNENLLVVSAELKSLIASEGQTPTALQTKVFNCIKFIAKAVLETKKEIQPEWADINVDAIMSLFKAPKV